MRFRRVWIVMASLGLALVAATTSYSEGEAEAASATAFDITLTQGLEGYHPPLQAYNDTAINRLRLAATAIAEPSRYSGFTRMQFQALADPPEGFRAETLALIKDGVVQPVTIPGCDEDCWKKAVLSYNAEMNPAIQSLWDNWYRLDDQGDLNLLVYCAPEAQWNPCETRQSVYPWR